MPAEKKSKAPVKKAAHTKSAKIAHAWSVRPARSTDREIIEELLDDAQDHHAKISPLFFRRARPKLGVLGDHETILLVMTETGKIVGLSHVRVFDTPDDVTLVRTKRADLQALIVRAKYRKLGCGRALLDATTAWARAHGATMMVLTVWAQNQGAERFYKKLGYTRVSQVLGTRL